MRSPRLTTLTAAWLVAAGLASAKAAERPEVAPPPPPAVNPAAGPVAAPETGEIGILAGEVRPIDLYTALRLAGVQNPDLLTARQVVVEAVALRQLAAVQILPTLNAGTNYNAHSGNLQQSNGNILSLNRSAVYVGAGAFTVAAGTMAIPGVVLQGNIAEGLFLYLESRQLVKQRQFAAIAVRNDILLDVALAFCEMIRAEGQRAILVETIAEAEELVKITAAYARTGQGRQADADRAASDMLRRRADLRRAEGQILIASARLSQLLNLDPSIRLRPTDIYAVPIPIVPEPMPLCELIALALLKRPEMAERQAVIREAMLALAGSKLLPFSPTILIGYSGGGFGGGGNLVQPTFGAFSSRTDFDAVAYWSLRNMGIGNLALINAARAQVQTRKFQELATLDRVRDEVAEAYAASHARFAQIAEDEQAVRSSSQGFRLDLARIKEGVPGEGRNPRPIEVLDSLRLFYRSRQEYLNAIVDYNQAHFRLYVALGQPPAAALARAAPSPATPAAPVPPPPDSTSPFITPGSDPRTGR